MFKLCHIITTMLNLFNIITLIIVQEIRQDRVAILPLCINKECEAITQSRRNTKLEQVNSSHRRYVYGK